MPVSPSGSLPDCGPSTRWRSAASWRKTSTASRPGSRRVPVVSASDSEAMSALVDPGAEYDLIEDGFGFTEGPVWHEDGSLFFTDVPNDTIARWRPETGAETWRRPAGIPAGLTRDPKGRLLCCEQSTSALARYDA